MKEITGYITLRVKITCPDNRDNDDVLDDVGSNCTYQVGYDCDLEHVKVEDTEILSCEAHRHLGDD